jgi:hypothetical protein
VAGSDPLDGRAPVWVACIAMSARVIACIATDARAVLYSVVHSNAAVPFIRSTVNAPPPTI